MSIITFDTIEYFDDLVAAGVSEAQAKAQSKALKRVVDEVIGGELATKADLLTTQNALTADLKDLELKIEKRFARFDGRFFELEKRFVRLEVLMALMLAVLLIPTLKSLL